MIERESLADKPERLIEAKYKYLADFNRNQFSPNLKKHYHDSFSMYSNSQDRQSPSYISSKRKSSYKKSFQKPSLKKRQVSPSCSTFNPRRQTTLDEFSPYDQKQQKREQALNKQLIQQNQLLKNKLAYVQDKIKILNTQLTKKQTEILKVRELHQCDIKYYEQAVVQMTNQIKIVLTKNKMLENQLSIVNNKLHEEYRRQDQYQRVEQQRRKIQQHKRKQQFRRRQYFQKSEEFKKIEQRKSSIPQGVTKRSVGKLLVRPMSNINSQDPSLGTSKIKIEDESQYNSQSNIENLRSTSIINNCDKDNKKGEELISSIRSMQLKIAGQQSSSLKDLCQKGSDIPIVALKDGRQSLQKHVNMEPIKNQNPQFKKLVDTFNDINNI